MRCACIDVGSNTTALLVADIDDGKLTQIATRRRFTLIGEGLGESGVSDAKIAEVEDAVAELVEFALEHGAEPIVIATHVVREAANGVELTARVAARVGLPVEIVDGHREARFSFIGATGGIESLARPTIVIDAGGGSTEVTRCEPGGEPETATFAVGSAAIQTRFFDTDPPRQEQFIAAREFVDQAFSGLAPAAGYGTVLIVGGGATTAQAILGGVIDAAGTDRVLATAAKHTAAELAERFGIEYHRARLLPASLIVLGALSTRLGMELEVGRGGLREGVLLDRFRS